MDLEEAEPEEDEGADRSSRAPTSEQLEAVAAAVASVAVGADEKENVLRLIENHCRNDAKTSATCPRNDASMRVPYRCII